MASELKEVTTQISQVSVSTIFTGPAKLTPLHLARLSGCNCEANTVHVANCVVVADHEGLGDFVRHWSRLCAPSGDSCNGGCLGASHE